MLRKHLKYFLKQLLLLFKLSRWKALLRFWNYSVNCRLYQFPKSHFLEIITLETQKLMEIRSHHFYDLWINGVKNSQLQKVYVGSTNWFSTCQNSSLSCVTYWRFTWRRIRFCFNIKISRWFCRKAIWTILGNE